MNICYKIYYTALLLVQLRGPNSPLTRFISKETSGHIVYRSSISFTTLWASRPITAPDECFWWVFRWGYFPPKLNHWLTKLTEWKYAATLLQHIWCSPLWIHQKILIMITNRFTPTALLSFLENVLASSTKLIFCNKTKKRLPPVSRWRVWKRRGSFVLHPADKKKVPSTTACSTFWKHRLPEFPLLNGETIIGNGEWM